MIVITYDFRNEMTGFNYYGNCNNPSCSPNLSSIYAPIGDRMKKTIAIALVLFLIGY